MNGRFREARKSRGLTLNEVASLIGCSYGAVSNAELGRSDTAGWYIRAFCSALGISEHWLRTGEGQMDAVQGGDVRALAEAVARECGGSDVFRALVEVYLQMDAQGKETLARFVRLVSERVRRGESATPLPSLADLVEAREVSPPEMEEGGAS